MKLRILTFLLLATLARAADTLGTVTEGKQFTLSVVNDGTAPFQFQWYKAGNQIAGATNATYVVPAAKPTDAASYAVKVVNPYGQVVSNNAIVTVTPAPKAPTVATVVFSTP